MSAGFNAMDIDGSVARLQAGGLLTINLRALRANYRLLADKLAPSRVAAVVKADCYGLGAARIVPVFYEEGCRDFFVAHLGEGLKIRPRLPADASIYVLNGLQPQTEAICAEAGIVPVLNSLEQLRNWAAVSRAAPQVLPAVLQVDTGMARLGLSSEELDELVADLSVLDAIDVRFVMSHLACADEADNPANEAQLQTLCAALRRLPEMPVAFANSGGAFLPDGFHFDLARPGVALYGVAPTVGKSNPMQPVVELHARVIQVRSIPAGTPVGYGGAYVSQTPMRVATIAVGYADGWSRHLSNRGAAYFGDVRLPIIGRVSMDSITLDVTALPEGALALGSLVELIGPHQTLEDVAADCGTIPYEILTGLGQRYSRHYFDADVVATNS